MIEPALLGEAEALLALCRNRGVTIATAESCTGGLIAAVLTAIPGSSDVVERGFVTYSNAAKTELLGVPAGLIASVGAVSAEVARAMAEGAIAASSAGLALSVTGVAGPGGGTAAKPVGLVFLGLARRGGAAAVERRMFPGDRTAVRLASVRAAFALVRGALQP
ncbi:MAG: nicotinamide-nucleotide amidohydrolase family protein [Acetobacteraceae bacterium]